MLRSPLFLAATWLVTCLAALTAGLAMRLAPVEMSTAWPTVGMWPRAIDLTAPIALATAVLSGLTLFIASGTAREKNRSRPFGELLFFFPMLFAFVWFLLPTGRPNTPAIIAGSLLLAACLFLFFNSPGPLPRNQWRWKTSTIIFDAGFVLLPVLVGYLLGAAPDFKSSGFSLFLYPVYAFVQLSIFLVIPVTRLRAIGLSREKATLFTALIFALIHWPNPLVMVVTLAGMLLWAYQYQNGRSLWQLALVMGLAATTFSQFLPDDFTHHMRVGPNYVRAEAVVLMANNSQQSEPAYFIEKIYPQTMGREIFPEEKQTWTSLVEYSRRCTWAYMFLASPENRKRLTAHDDKEPPTDVKHWSDWPDEWKNRILFFATDNYWEKSGETLDGYLQALYVDILGRQETTEGLKNWQTTMSFEQRQRIAEVLLERRLNAGQTVFEGMDIEEFRLPN